MYGTVFNTWDNQMFELPPGTAALCIEVLSNVEFGPATVGNQPGMVRRKDDSYMHDVGIDEPHPAARRAIP